MIQEELQKIVDKFNLRGEVQSITPYGDGHINETYLVITTRQKYILQRINNMVFKDIELLMKNIELVVFHAHEAVHARGGDADREAMTLVHTKNGEKFLSDNGKYYRVYVFIDKTVSLNQARTEQDFYESGVAFGKFAKMLDGFDASQIRDVIENFHDTRVRFDSFIKAVEADRVGRADEVRKEIEFYRSREEFCGRIVDMLESGSIPWRVTHNDTKLNNVLLDEKTGKAVAVIDLDTVMKGSVCYDFGDSVRFGCSTALEDEEDLSKVHFSLELFDVYSRGFIGAMGDTLTENELLALPLGSVMMTLECGMRFLTDYLDGDRYFRVTKDKHNLIRCRTHIRLVEEMEACYDKMVETVKKYKK